jgi:hypothetical protein
MGTIGVNLIGKIVVNGDTEFGDFVDVVHDVFELLAVAAFLKAGLRVGDEKVSVDHLMKYSFFQLIGGPVLKQGLR